MGNPLAIGFHRQRAHDFVVTEWRANGFDQWGVAGLIARALADDLQTTVAGQLGPLDHVVLEQPANGILTNLLVVGKGRNGRGVVDRGHQAFDQGAAFFFGFGCLKVVNQYAGNGRQDERGHRRYEGQIGLERAVKELHGAAMLRTTLSPMASALGTWLWSTYAMAPGVVRTASSRALVSGMGCGGELCPVNSNRAQ